MKLGPGEAVIKKPSKKDWDEFRKREQARLAEKAKKEKKRIEKANEDFEDQEWLDSDTSCEGDDEQDEDWVIDRRPLRQSQINIEPTEHDEESSEHGEENCKNLDDTDEENRQDEEKRQKSDAEDKRKEDALNNNVVVSVSKTFVHIEYDASKVVNEKERSDQRLQHKSKKGQKSESRAKRKGKSILERKEEFVKDIQRVQNKKVVNRGKEKKRGPYCLYSRERMEQAVKEMKKRLEEWRTRQGEDSDSGDELDDRNMPKKKYGYYSVAKEFDVPVQTLWDQINSHRRPVSGRYVYNFLCHFFLFLKNLFTAVSFLGKIKFLCQVKNLWMLYSFQEEM